VNFVVSSCLVVALVLYFADVTPRAKAGGAHAVHEVLSQCVKTVSLNLHFASQRCIPESVSQSYLIRDKAYKKSIVVKPPVVSVALNKSKGLEQRAGPAVHFVLQKSTKPFKPLLSAASSFLHTVPLSASMLQGSADNAFPYGQCTWWANQRYYELHRGFVPWRSNANAFQWVSRAIEFGWHVSDDPIVGSIMVLQPGIEGAYGLGHVGVVEQVLRDGRVIASSMNWGSHPGMVTQATYVLGSGVSFLSNY
jgi:surface antigen